MKDEICLKHGDPENPEFKWNCNECHHEKRNAQLERLEKQQDNIAGLLVSINKKIKELEK